MALKETINHMNKLLEQLVCDMGKAVKGNKAASQRVRTCSIQFGKWSKLYRKESITAERGGSSGKKASSAKKATKAKATKKPAAKKAAPKKKIVVKKKATTYRPSSSSRSKRA